MTVSACLKVFSDSPASRVSLFFVVFTSSDSADASDGAVESGDPADFSATSAPEKSSFVMRVLCIEFFFVFPCFDFFQRGVLPDLS